MTTATDTATMVVNGVDLRSLATDIAWSVDFELVPGKRPFGPDDNLVDVQEIHSGGVTYGFLVAHGLPDRNSYLAVSELDGDERWNVVGEHVDGDDEDDMDAAGRAVIVDLLVRTQLRAEKERENG